MRIEAASLMRKVAAQNAGGTLIAIRFSMLKSNKVPLAASSRGCGPIEKGKRQRKRPGFSRSPA
jgi:hypothetical protein